MLPEITTSIDEPLADAMVRIGFARSKREARHLISAGAVRLRKLTERLEAAEPDETTYS